MKTNEELQSDVEKELNWEPLLAATEIAVTAKEGIITLMGMVHNYGEKLKAEEIARKVSGVKAVVENTKVELDSNSKVTDSDIARQVLNAYQWNWKIPNHKIKIKVEDGWVTLEGNVKWHYQKDAAKNALNNLIGVRGVINDITIKSETDDQIEKDEIKLAFGRNAAINNNTIQVDVKNSNVSLHGQVQTWYQKQEAGRLAFNAKGVETVDNELTIDHSYEMFE